MSTFQYPEIYRDILDGLQIGVSVLDLENRIVFWSDGAEQITGYSRIDVLGHSCMESILLHCNQTSCEMCTVRCPVAAALHDARPVEAASFIHHKSGHRTPVHTWAIPLRDRHGSMIGVIQTFEGEFEVNGPDPNERSMKEHGCLDDTTGLPNQAIMQSHLRETLGRFTELQLPFGIICVEVREFQHFRARYGQEAATSMSKVLARTFRLTIWPTDFVGHWTEGRFLAILSGCDESALLTLCERVFRLLSSATITWWGEELSVAISIGCTCAAAGDTPESILQRGLALKINPVAPPARAAGAGNPS